jgi:hypothetical protein
MHTLLRLNLACFQNGYHHNINFVNDDPFEKADVITRHLKCADRILFIDYSIFIDPATIERIFKKFDNYHGVVFPCVTDGVNWDQFSKKVKKGTTEPTEQIGLDFDTTVGQKISDSLYKIQTTNPKCWLIDTKFIFKAMRDKKGEGIKIPAKMDEMFKKFIEKGAKIYAYTACKLIVTYPHECLSNILESAGVKKGDGPP